MAVIAFDTLNCARRLVAAGIPQQQADALAEIMAEAFVYNVDQLVTKDYLDARLDASEQRLERLLDERFGRVDGRFSSMELRFAAIDQKFVEIDGKFRLIYWMLGVVIASTTLPALAKLFGLG